MFDGVCFQDLGVGFGIVFKEGEYNFNIFGYRSLPKCYGLLDTSNIEAIGVGQVRRQPYLGYQGNGVLVGILDTGIDYTHPAFIREDGTTKIAAIWDQTVQDETVIDNNGEEDAAVLYGREYSREEINAALRADDPYRIVPERDENGHGTAMAGIISGNVDRRADFSGVAPLSTLVVVKLKQAKQKLRDYFKIPDGADCYSESDLMYGIYYLLRKAKELSMPLVVYFGVGTSQGSHTGESMLCQYIDAYAELPLTIFVAAAGNETNRGHHFYGRFTGSEQYIDTELRVAEGEDGFSLELWTESTEVFTVAIFSPGGEYTGRIPALWRTGYINQLLLEKVKIETNYYTSDQYSVRQLILMRFSNLVPGIWRIRVFPDGNVKGNFHIWLPMEQFLKPETRFLSPTPDVVICDPGDGRALFTISAYDHRTGGMYLYSSRGYTADGMIKPELAAPGVNIPAPDQYGGYTEVSGTSPAAAHVAGMCAIMLEWSVVEGFTPVPRGGDIPNLMLLGAQKTGLIYPNPESGYGFANLYGVFDVLRKPPGV